MTTPPTTPETDSFMPLLNRCDSFETFCQEVEDFARRLERERDEARAENKRLREVLARLTDAAEFYAADQTGASDSRCGLVQPISVEDGVELNEAIAAANGVLAAIELKELDSALIGELAESRAENKRLREAKERGCEELRKQQIN